MKATLKQELTKLKQGDHVCSIYENVGEQLAVVVPFIMDGLARGERCVYITDDRTIDEVAQALATAGLDVVHERQRGALRLLTRHDTYFRAGEFIPQAMIDFIRDAETEALADGYTGLRLTGETTWMLLPEPGADRLIEYEALLSYLPTNSKSVLLCQYNHSRLDAPCIYDAFRTHPLTILGDRVFPNPYYELPEMVLSKDQAVATSEFRAKRVDWWMAQLLRPRTAEQERERALKKLKRSERRLAEAQQVAHIGSWERDLRTNELNWSNQLYRLLGLQASQASISYQQLLGQETLPNSELAAKRVDWWISQLKRARAAQHERQRLKEELRVRDECERAEWAELEQIYRYAPVGLCFVDTNLRYVRINEQLAAMNGKPVAQHLRRTVREIVPEMAADIEQNYYSVLATGEPILNVEAHGITPAQPGVERDWLVSYIPLKSSNGALLGVSVAVIEITQRKQAEKTLAQYADRLHTLSARLLDIQEHERRHLARELHDEVGQTLTGLRLLLKPTQDPGPRLKSTLDQAQALVDELLARVRGLSFDLRPAILDQLGLLPSLLTLFERYTEQTGVVVNFKHNQLEGRFEPEVETASYRIVQEALTNAARHARVGAVVVRVWVSTGLLGLQIEDQGVGFEPEPALAAPRSSGLAGMRERVLLHKGKFTIDSRPGGPTQITAEIPVRVLP